MNAKLGGCLIGYGLKKKDGTFKKVMFDKPIHNTITKHCLNNLLTFDGTNALPTGNYVGNYLSIFVKSSQTSDRYGVINSCCLGDGTGETSVNDTDLKHRVSAQTTTKKTGWGWCGSTIDQNNACVKMRISHTHAISQDFTVKEVGWYNAINDSGTLNYTLSARVQLDEFIDVENGDEFYSIYELTVTWQGIEKFNDLAGFGGGYEVNGINCSDWDIGHLTFTRMGLPLIGSDGLPYSGATHGGGSGNGYPRPKVFPVWSINQAIGPGDFRYQYVCKLNTDWDKTKAFDSGSKNGNIVTDGSKITNIAISDYIQDSFRRDFSFVVAADFFGSDTYGILVNGTLYRFGTFDENDNFTPTPVTINGALRLTVRQSWSTDLLTPAA